MAILVGVIVCRVGVVTVGWAWAGRAISTVPAATCSRVRVCPTCRVKPILERTRMLVELGSRQTRVARVFLAVAALVRASARKELDGRRWAQEMLRHGARQGRRQLGAERRDGEWERLGDNHRSRNARRRPCGRLEKVGARQRRTERSRQRRIRLDGRDDCGGHRLSNRNNNLLLALGLALLGQEGRLFARGVCATTWARTVCTRRGIRCGGRCMVAAATAMAGNGVGGA
ncbi:hypothetical protein CAOG_009518 [Capsaspora owczarzaki ATCC 30864]|uniref:Uncharacterized protein n=1 Tax=Capsaspora owczarzaki (strain ATCC 30864) TaxID=595528 RepID=A0A0D2U7F4_CAPO3|nr:hypothetical protein CAOG_009518 [Capsaspora owczarzaki ATCC 30864]